MLEAFQLEDLSEAYKAAHPGAAQASTMMRVRFVGCAPVQVQVARIE
jgi:hypothetical protein